MATGEYHSDHSVSRRDFFKIVTGSIVAMPAVAGGFLAPPTIAYAEEDLSETHGGTADGVVERIVVVAKNEAGFCVVDMSKGGTDKVVGASVRVTSRYNGKSVEDVTDDDGIVRLDIRELAENPDDLDLDKLDTYEFNGSILITCDGYRTVEIPLARIEGASPMIVPSRTLTDGLPYPRSTSFDEWDALYTENAFAQTPSNTDEHVLSLDWRQMGTGKAAIALKRGDTGETLLSTTATPSDGVLTASFKGAFLKEGAADALPKDVAFVVEVVQDGHTYSNDINFKVVEGAIAAPASEEELTLTPINTNSGGSNQTGLDLKWPSGLPLVGGGSLKTWSPDLPVNVYVNPFGYIQVTIKSPSWGYKADNSGSDEQGWGTYPQKSVADQFNKMVQTAEKMSTATTTALASPKFFSKIDMAASFSLMGNFQIVAAAQWSKEKGTFQGLLGAQLFLACDASITENFFAGPIPVLVTFAINSSLTVGINCGIYSVKDPNKPEEKLIEAAFDFSRWKFDYTDTGLTATINITPSMSVGVGIRGVASISVQGKFTLMMYFGFTYRGELDPKTHPLPHYIFGYSAQINLVMHMFLFTKTFSLKNWKYRDFYNNWDPNLKAAAAEDEGDLLQAMANESMPSLLGQMNIITDDMLSQTVEFDGSTEGDLVLIGQSANEDDIVVEEPTLFDWETMREEDVTAPLDDGTLITYTVYSLLDEGEESAEAEGTDESQQDESQQDESQQGDVTTAQQPQDAETVVAGTTGAGAGHAEDAAVPEVTEADVVLSAMTEGVLSDETGQVAGTERSSEGSVAQDDAPAGEADAPADGAEAPAGEVASEAPAEAVATSEEPVVNTAAENASARKRGHLRRKSSVVYTRRGSGSGSGSGLLQTMGWNFLELPEAAVMQLGSERGIRPSSDTIVAEKVFGDPRVKVLNVNLLASTDEPAYATCCFRIASVMVDGVPRTRLVMSILDMPRGDEKWAISIPRYRVLDFDINDIEGVSHKDLYDYDFDVALTAHTEQWASGPSEWTDVIIEDLQIVVVSGRRALGDDTSLASVATDLVFTYLSFEVEELRFETNIDQISRSILASDVMGADGRYHCISSLQCVPDADSDSKVAIVSYLDRIANTPDDILSDEEGKVDIKPSFVLVNVRNGSMLIPNRADIDAKMGVITDPGVFELSLSPKIGGYYTLAMRGLKRTYFYLLGVDSDNATLSSIMMGATLDSSMHLVPWPQQDCFLTSYPKAEYVETLAQNWQDPNKLDRSQWVLQKAAWNTETAVPNMATLSFEPVGPESFNFSTFGINSHGTFIFWPQGKGGDDGRIYNEDGSFEQNEDVPVYQIMACRIRDGKFGDPFVAADVSHDMASIHVVDTRGESCSLEVLSTELVDPNDDEVYYASNLWYTSVPNLKCATALGCECPIPLAAPGGTLRFNITIRNDGNTYLSGCYAAMWVHDENGLVHHVNSTKVTFSEKTLLESRFNPRLEDGSLQDVESDFSLAPGKCSVYAADVIIPSEWEGDKYVSFTATAPEMVEHGGLNAQSDGGWLSAQAEDDELVYQSYEAAPGEYKVYAQRTSTDQDPERTHMHVITVISPEAQGDPYSDAPVRTGGPGDTRPGDDAGPSSSEPTRDTRGTGEKLPETGDPSSIALPVGLALAGAALTAYGTRRAAKESAEEEERNA